MSTNRATDNYEQHMLGCADIAVKVAERLGLRDNGAVQACFATICIDAQKHGVFMEPTPPTTKAPVTPPPAAKPEAAKIDVSAAQKDAQAAAKADAQIKDIDPNPTPEKAEQVGRTKLLEGVNEAVKLLNKEGLTPPMTGRSLNAYINEVLNLTNANLGSLDVEQLEILLKKLCATLDMLRENKAALDEEAPF